MECKAGKAGPEQHDYRMLKRIRGGWMRVISEKMRGNDR